MPSEDGWALVRGVGYSGLTYEAYALDLRQYVTWCTEHHVVLFGARRADIETFGRHLEALGRARATIARRLCTVAAFYRYAEPAPVAVVNKSVAPRRTPLLHFGHPLNDQGDPNAPSVHVRPERDRHLSRGPDA